jgi:DNA polymerase III delta subunit
MTTSKNAVKVTNSAKPAQAKPASFSWDEKNQAVIVEAYKTEQAANAQNANSTKFLATVAALVGAKSAQAVRSKLSSMKEYSALDKVSATITKPRITKPKLADDIRDLLTASGVDVSEEAANSLANANAEALKAVISGLSMLDAPEDEDEAEEEEIEA